MQAADYRFGRARVRPASRELIIDDEPAKLGARAFDLLLALIERRDRIVSKSELLDLVWPGLVVEENNLQVQVLALRKLLGQQSIATVPGRGYQLVAEVATNGPGARHDQVATLSSDAVAVGGMRRTEQPGVPGLPIHLIGRDADLKALETLAAEHRLVTIIGPGGVGKTRLAQALGAGCGGRFAEGAVWVDLAALNMPGMVPAAVATAVRAALVPGDEPLSALVIALEARSMLIILDNAEHMVDAAAHLVQRLLEGTVNCAFLVTSQAPLKIAGEQVYRLGALQLPQPQCTPAEALACSAVSLFVERASASTRGPRFADADVAKIGEICRHLDGLPLAIELAAARAARLGVAALVRNIDQRFRMLVSGERTAPVRQQTLKATFDWSHELLGTDAQIVFRRLAVFSGSFTLDAARAVVSDPGIDEWTVVEQLAELIDRSLVVLDNPLGNRYRLLETARVFALEKLQASGELQPLQQRHSLAIAHLANQCFDDFWNLGDTELLGRYVPDLDNLRAALHHAGDDPNLFARLAAGLLLLLRRLSLTRESLALSKDANALPEQDIEPALRARLWLASAIVTHQRDFARRSIELCRSLGDDRGLYLALNPLVHDPNPIQDEITAAAKESHRLRRADWSLKLQALGLGTEAWVALRSGELERASTLFREAIGLCDTAGADDLGTAYRMQQFCVTIATGDIDGAAAQIEAVLARCRTLQNAYRLTCTQAYLVNVRLAQGQLAAARAIATEFASYDRALGWPHVSEIVDALSLVAALSDRLDDAARLAGFADKVHQARDSDDRDGATKLSYSRVEALLRERLAADRMSLLKQEGRKLDIDQAVVLALRTEPA